MKDKQNYTVINKTKSNFDRLYDSKDPRDYFKYLGELDYIIPHLAQPIFNQIIQARAQLQSGPVTVLDLGASYGVNGALMKYQLDYEALRQRYTAPALQVLDSEEVLELDRAFYKSWPKNAGVRVIGHDVSVNAVTYAEACGSVDLGMAINFEEDDPSPAQIKALADVDLIVSTGSIGYISEKTFARIARFTDPARKPWVVSFVIRMFPFDEIQKTLEGLGLETEKFEGATFVQRRFADREEMLATVASVEARGIDTVNHERQGLYHADLFVSRPREAIEACPLSQLVSIVSGANKPWTVGTNVLAGYGADAPQPARNSRGGLTLAHSA